jgi:hypothetical protein
MRVDLIGYDGNIYQKEEVKLLSRAPYYQSSRYLRKGRYYYEFTHINGSQKYLIGFMANNEFYIAFSPFISYPSANVYFSESVECYEWSRKQDLCLSNINTEYTVGLGIDIEAKQFLIRINHEVRIIEMNIGTKVNYWRAVMTGMTSTNNYVDYISVNFGENLFKFHVPLGFTPLNNEFARSTCKNKRTEILLLQPIIATFILTSYDTKIDD